MQGRTDDAKTISLRLRRGIIIGGKLCLLRKHLHLFTYLFQAFELAALTGVALRLIIRGEYFDGGFAKDKLVNVYIDLLVFTRIAGTS